MFLLFLSWLCHTVFACYLFALVHSPEQGLEKCSAHNVCYCFENTNMSKRLESKHPHEWTLGIGAPTWINAWVWWRHKNVCLHLCCCCRSHRQAPHIMKVCVWWLSYSCFLTSTWVSALHVFGKRTQKVVYFGLLTRSACLSCVTLVLPCTCVGVFSNRLKTWLNLCRLTCFAIIVLTTYHQHALPLT